MMVSFYSRNESRKILDSLADIELPNEQARLDILKIHSSPITKHGEIGEWLEAPRTDWGAWLGGLLVYLAAAKTQQQPYF